MTSSALDLARDAVRFLATRLPGERCMVLTRDGQGLRLRATCGIEPSRLNRRGEISFQMVRRAVDTAEPVLLRDALFEDGFRENESVIVASLRSVLCVPFRDSLGNVRGVLYADHRRREGAFTEEHLQAALGFAEEMGRAWAACPDAEGPFEVLRLPRSRPEAMPAAPVPEGGAPSSTAIACFFRSLAVLLSSGILVHRAFELLARGEDPRMNRVAQGMAVRLLQGESISRTMAAYRHVFQPVHVHLVAMGEASGTLERVLRRLADFEERRRALALRLRADLTYPAFLFAFSVLALLLAPPLLLQPNFRLLQELGVDPPLLTRILMAAGHPLAWLALAGLAVAAPMAGRMLLQDRERLFRRLLAMRGLGPVLRASATARFARALALQVESGLEICLAVQQAGAVSGNPVLERGLQRSVAELRNRGRSLSGSLARTDFFTREFLDMVAVGERCGRLGPMLDTAAESAELHVEVTLGRLASLVEPLVMGVMGLIAAALVLGTMLPLVRALEGL